MSVQIHATRHNRKRRAYEGFRQSTILDFPRLGFQSNAPEFQKYLMNGWSFGFDVEQDERRESRRQEAEIQERVWKE